MNSKEWLGAFAVILGLVGMILSLSQILSGKDVWQNSFGAILSAVALGIGFGLLEKYRNR